MWGEEDGCEADGDHATGHVSRVHVSSWDRRSGTGRVVRGMVDAVGAGHGGEHLVVHGFGIGAELGRELLDHLVVHLLPAGWVDGLVHRLLGLPRVAGPPPGAPVALHLGVTLIADWRVSSSSAPSPASHAPMGSVL